MSVEERDLGEETLYRCTECGADHLDRDGAEDCCQDSGLYAGAEFSEPDSDVWPDAHAEHDAWMLRKNGKKPWAPWTDEDAPVACNRQEHDGDDVTCAECEHSAQFKWGSDGSAEHVHADIETALDWREKHPSAREDLTFIQSESDPFAFVDGDDVRCPSTGEVHPGFVDILERLGGTYVDISTSGTGAHAMYVGELPERVKQAAFEIDSEPWGENDEDDLPTVEIYAGKHVCVATGEHVPGTPDEVREWDADELKEILDEHDELPPDPSERGRLDDIDLESHTADASGREEIATDIRDCYQALDRLRVKQVAEDTIVSSWNDSATTSDGKRAFYPTYGTNSSGTATYVDFNQGIYADTGDMSGYGGPVVMALIDAGKVKPGNATPKVTGETWFEGYNRLRDTYGYDLPLYVPEKGTERAGGEDYEQTPLWALTNAAVLLGVCERDELVEKEGQDGGVYQDFPDAETFNAALDALEEENVEHGRNRRDVTPDRPAYDVRDDIELRIYPQTGDESVVVVYHNGVEAYSERRDTPLFKSSGKCFWESPQIRASFAGNAASELTGVDEEDVKEKIKSTLVDVARDDDTDEFREKMRTDTFLELRRRTHQVLVKPHSEETYFEVVLEPPERSDEVGERSVEFDAGGFNNKDPGQFETQHLAVFYEKIDVDPATWTQLTDYWLEVKQKLKKEQSDALTTALEQFLSDLRRKYSPREKDAFDPEKRHTWVEASGKYETEVAWVASRRVKTFLDENAPDITQGELSEELRKDGVMLDTSNRRRVNGERASLWPLEAEEIGHSVEQAEGDSDGDGPDGVAL
jgi:hypothetical protein